MLILASKSPRRKELLGFITNDFIVVSEEIDETVPEDMTPENAVLYLSRKKAELFQNSEDVVIGADTIVVLNGKILGKPADEEEAFSMLKSLSGKEHSVLTGVTLISPSGKKSFYKETKVKFFELSDGEISNYIKTGECMDKAGAYGIQGFGSLLVEKIDGDYFNVVGLPVSALFRELQNPFFSNFNKN
ncbi:MAG: Maf family protein [Eubacterium sp.]